MEKRKRIILPEVEDGRILEAALSVAKTNVVEIVLLDNGNLGHALPPSIKLINTQNKQTQEIYANVLFQKRQHKGLTLSQAKELVKDKAVFAMLALAQNQVDALVAGAVYSSQSIISNALKIIGVQANTKLVSSFFLMVFDESHSHYGKQMLFSDCAMNINPDANALFEIASSSINSAKQILDEPPKIAFLSFSTNQSASHNLVDKVRLAAELTQEKFPNYRVVGDIQLDAALDERVFELKYKNNNFNPPANVLIFPSLEAANIGYKLVQKFTKAKAVGPILQGLNKPVSDLSRGCSVEDIIDTIHTMSKL